MPAGAKRFPVEVDENCVLHITQAALAPGAKKGSRASVSVTVDGEPPVVLGTLTGGSCDQMMMDLLFHADFHVDVTNGPVYLSGYMTLVGDGLDDMALDEAEGDDYDDSDSDSDDDDYDAEAGSDDYDSDLDDYADYDSEGDDDGEELDIEDLPPKLQLKLLKHTKALEKARGEADDSDSDSDFDSDSDSDSDDDDDGFAGLRVPVDSDDSGDDYDDDGPDMDEFEREGIEEEEDGEDDSDSESDSEDDSEDEDDEDEDDEEEDDEEEEEDEDEEEPAPPPRSASKKRAAAAAAPTTPASAKKARGAAAAADADIGTPKTPAAERAYVQQLRQVRRVGALALAQTHPTARAHMRGTRADTRTCAPALVARAPEQALEKAGGSAPMGKLGSTVKKPKAAGVSKKIKDTLSKYPELFVIDGNNVTLK